MTAPIFHRGDTRDAEENTIKAFKDAQAKSRAYEFDIHPTASGTICVIHDTTWDRTTSFEGTVSATTQEEIDTIRTLGGARIPSLREALLYADDHAPLLIDMKDTEVWGDEHIAVLRTRVIETGVTESFVFLNNRDLMARMRTLAPEVRLCFRPLGDEEFDLALVDSLGAKAIQPEYRVMTRKRVAAYQDAGYRVILQGKGVNSKAKFDDAMSLEANNILIDAKEWEAWK